MSLNMYVSETDAQIKSMNAICIDIIQGMEKVINSIHSFTFAFSLDGEAYTSAKQYMTEIYIPLAQGMIYLCEELIRQNDRYPSDFKTKVSEIDLVEHEIREQIADIDRLKMRMDAISIELPFMQAMSPIYEHMKYQLEEKLSNLYAFNSITGNHYDTAIQLASQIARGLTEIHSAKRFHHASGTFTTKGMNMDWAAQLDAIHYRRKAYDHYGDYLREYPADTEKIIAIIKYEETHPNYVGQMNEFLAPLEAKDATEIKYLMYEAEETGIL